MDMILGINVNFKIVFLIFKNICCRYILEFKFAPTAYVHSINECIFTIKQVFTIFSTTFLSFSVMSM